MTALLLLVLQRYSTIMHAAIVAAALLRHTTRKCEFQREISRSAIAFPIDRDRRFAVLTREATSNH